MYMKPTMSTSQPNKGATVFPLSPFPPHLSSSQAPTCMARRLESRLVRDLLRATSPKKSNN